MKLYLVNEISDDFGFHIVHQKLYPTFEKAKEHKLEWGGMFEIIEIDTDELTMETVFSYDDYVEQIDISNRNYVIDFANNKLANRTVEGIIKKTKCYSPLWEYDFTNDDNYLYLEVYDRTVDYYISYRIPYDISKGFNPQTDMNEIKDFVPTEYTIETY